jgi:hypothetical protein
MWHAWESREICKGILQEKTKERLFGKPGHGWEGDVKMDHKKNSRRVWAGFV